MSHYQKAEQYIPKLSAVVLLWLLTFNVFGQNASDAALYKKLKHYDLSSVFNPDSIIDDEHTKIKRPEPLGYIGENYQRFQIHLLSVVKSKSNPYEYAITGKTKVKDNICSFTGSITVVKASYDTSGQMTAMGFSTFKAGEVTALLKIQEDKTHAGSGIIDGKLTSDVYFDDKDKIYYNALTLMADGFCNNQVEGRWTSYKTGKSKKCNWGDFRIPDSREMDEGTGEFHVNEKYRLNGWESYDDRNNETWWTNRTE